MKQNFRIIGKMSFLLVIIGFLMPVACDQNGFEIAKYMVDADKNLEGVLLYLLFASAIVGVLLGILLLSKINVKTSVDWLTIIVCITSGLVVYFRLLEGGPELQHGAYVILTGWVIALLTQIIAIKE